MTLSFEGHFYYINICFFVHIIIFAYNSMALYCTCASSVALKLRKLSRSQLLQREKSYFSVKPRADRNKNIDKVTSPSQFTNMTCQQKKFSVYWIYRIKENSRVADTHLFSVLWFFIIKQFITLAPKWKGFRIKQSFLWKTLFCFGSCRRIIKFWNYFMIVTGQ